MSVLPPEKKLQCREIFDYFDKKNTGTLSKEAFSDAIKSLGIFIPKDELNGILDKLPAFDYQHFEEICANKLSNKVNKDEIIKAFSFLDPHKTGQAPAGKIKRAMMTLGEPLKEKEINELLKEFTQGGNVDYKKFIVALVGK